MLRIGHGVLLWTAVCTRALAVFQHAECYNAHGESTGVEIARGRKAAFHEGFQLKDSGRLTKTNGALVPFTKEMGADAEILQAIPDECFVDGELGRNETWYDLQVCAAGRTPLELLQICMAICSKVPDCLAVEFDEFHRNGGMHKCHLHAQRGSPVLGDPQAGVEYPKCGHAPSRYACSDRVEDEWLGIWCPDPLPAYKYQPRNTEAVPSPMGDQTWVIGGTIGFNTSGIECTCNEALKREWAILGRNEYCPTDGASRASQAALNEALMEVLGVQKARVECPTTKDLEAPKSFFVYWLEVQPHLSSTIQQTIDDAECDDSSGVVKDCSTEPSSSITGRIATKMADKLGLSSISLLVFGQSSWTIDGWRESVLQETPQCVTNGKLTGLGISPHHYAVEWDVSNFLPEEHAETQVILRSMVANDDWYPIPEGCFFDTTSDGTPSNPALKRFGRHYELLGPNCLGERSQQEMLRICLSICKYVDWGMENFLEGEVDSSIDKKCIAVNYDEHGLKGHCHIYSAHEFRITGHQSSMCGKVKGRGREGICLGADITPRDFCVPAGQSNLGSPSCGINNTLGVFCHFNPLRCTDTGYHALGVTLIEENGNITNFIPREVPIAEEETTSPLFGMPGGAGRDGACKPCDSGTYSDRVLKNYERRELIPRPADFPDTVNVCKTCPEGRFCIRGDGCPWGGDRYSCPPRCPLGHYCPVGSEKGSMCPLNEYQDEDGQSACKACPTGFNFNRGAENLQSCLCPNGYRRTRLGSQFDADDLSPCTPCIDGMLCEWDQAPYINSTFLSQFAAYDNIINEATEYQTVPHLAPGFWATAEEPTTVYLCDPTRVEPFCPGGNPAEALGAGGLCKGLRSGLLCDLCPEGWVRSPGVEEGCEECGGNQTLQFVGAFFLVLVFLIAGYALMATGEGSVHTASDIDPGIASVLVGRLVQTVQVLAIFGSLAVPWPIDLRALFAFFSFMNIDLQVISIACVASTPFLQYLTQAIMVLIILAWLPLLYTAVHFAPLPERFKMSRTMTKNATGGLMVLLFLSIMSFGISPFICLSHPAPDALNTMAAYRSIACWTDAHNGMVITGIGMLLVNFLFLSFMVYLAWALPKRAMEDSPEHEEFVKSSKFVFNKYKPSVWYFGCIILVRNIAVAVIPSVATGEPCFQITLLNALMVLSIMLQCFYWPWNAPISNMADSISLFGSCLVAAFAVPWLPASENGGLFITTTQVIIVVMLLFCCLGAMVSAALQVPQLKRFTKIHNAGSMFINMGRKPPTAEQVTQEFVETFTEILAMSKEELLQVVEPMRSYDLWHLQRIGHFCHIEFQNNDATKKNSVKLVRMRSGGRLSSTSSGSRRDKSVSEIDPVASVTDAEVEEPIQTSKV